MVMTGSPDIYNYFRDYDPSTGRYVQSDPVGLVAGINTYGYVHQNPLVWRDPLGLKITGQLTDLKVIDTNVTYLGSEEVKPYKEVEKGYKYLILNWLYRVYGTGIAHIRCHDDTPCAQRDWDIEKSANASVQVEVGHYETTGPFSGWRDFVVGAAISIDRNRQAINAALPMLRSAAAALIFAGGATPDIICGLNPGLY